MSLIATEGCIWAKDFVACRGKSDHHVCQSVCLWNNEFETLLPLLPVKRAQCHFQVAYMGVKKYQTCV